MIYSLKSKFVKSPFTSWKVKCEKYMQWNAFEVATEES